MLLATLAMAASACSSSGTDPDQGGSPAQTEGIVSGDAADPMEATRKIIVAASDDLRFDPASIEVKAGEAVTFVVRNVGKTVHEFVLGDSAYQQMHEADMQGGDHEMDVSNSVSVGPGETSEFTWRFDTAGATFACLNT